MTDKNKQFLLEVKGLKTYFFTEDFATTGVIIQGDVNLNTKNATEAWFNYTMPIPDSAFLNGISWDLRADEWLGGSSSSQIAEVIIEFNFPANGYTAEEKQLIESVAGTSPVPLSVHPDLKQTIRFNW